MSQPAWDLDYRALRPEPGYGISRQKARSVNLPHGRGIFAVTPGPAPALQQACRWPAPNQITGICKREVYLAQRGSYHPPSSSWEPFTASLLAPTLHQPGDGAAIAWRAPSRSVGTLNRCNSWGYPGQPTCQRASEPASQRAGKQASQPTVQQVRWLDNQAGQPGGWEAGRPGSQTGNLLGRRAASQVSSQTASKVAAMSEGAWPRLGV